MVTTPARAWTESSLIWVSIPRTGSSTRSYPRLTGITPTHLRALEAGTFFYALLHSIEGIGLILERDWAGYLVVVASSSLIPFEIYEIFQKPNLVRITLLVLNVGIVIYLVVTLRKEYSSRSKRTI